MPPTYATFADKDPHFVSYRYHNFQDALRHLSALQNDGHYFRGQNDASYKLFLFAQRLWIDNPNNALILDACVAIYTSQLDEDAQVEFKGSAKIFVRTYNFLATVLPYTFADWEKLSIFLNFLIPKLPAPKEDDLSKGILETIDMDSYRVEVKAQMSIALPDEDGKVAPVPTSAGGSKPDPDMERLSTILRQFNDLFGNIDWKDADKIRQVIAQELPAKVDADKKLSARQIEQLAHGFFRGPESMRQEIRKGHLSLPLQQLKDLPDDPDGCSEFERLFIADLEQAQKVLVRLMTKSADERLASRPFRAQAHLLCVGLLSRLPAFTKTLHTLYDRCGQT